MVRPAYMTRKQISIKKRFLLTGLILSALVFVLIYRANITIHSSSDKNIATIERMHIFGQTIRLIVKDLQSIEQEIYSQAIAPSPDSDNKVLENYANLLERSNELAAYAIDSKSSVENNKPSGFVLLIMNLYADIINIKPKLQEFIEHSIEVQRRYPGMSILTQQLLPANNRFIEAADLAIDEAEQKNAGPSASATTRDIENQFKKIRYAWAQQISWVRLFIANRSGIFGEAETSMQISLGNRKLYMDQVKTILGKLNRYEEQNLLDLQQSLSLEEMNEVIAEYEIYFEEAKKIYMSDKWREDLNILQKKLSPNLNSIWENLHQVQSALDNNTESGIRVSQDTTSKLSIYIQFVGLAVIILLLVGYLLFEYSLRKPIVQLAQALNAEAKGIKSNIDLKDSISETSVLLDAFKNMQQQVHTRQTRLQSILESAGEGIITITKDGIIEVFNPAAEKLFGYELNEVVGKNVSVLIPDDKADKHQKYLDDFNAHGGKGIINIEREVDARHKDGSTFPMSLKVTEMYIEGEKHYIAVVENISERKNMIHNLQRLAEHDSLTGLYNRHYFMEELEKTLVRAKRVNPSQMALLYIDLDNFKYVNDTLGHLAGDQLIVEAGALINKRTRASDVLARLGGDEFAIILNRSDPFCIETIAESFCNTLGGFNFKYKGKIVDISASIGAAIMSDDIESKEDLLARADFSCHEAKRLGRNRCHVYSAKDGEQMSNMNNDIGWARKIKDAIQHDNFVLACQPIVDIHTGAVTYSEVLIRMKDQNDNLILPGGFLPAAERFGLMSKIDEWVIDHALELLASIHSRNPGFRFSINLSASSLENTKFIDTIKSAISKWKIQPSALLFEVTETVAMNNLQNASLILAELQAIGCKTALDDFGTGYSSFTYLKELPVDFIKIDGSFVKDVDSNTLNQAMVRAISDIAHELGKATIAEFVESESIMNTLSELKIDYAQGFHLGRPEILSATGNTTVTFKTA
ncbi:MAG: EAL domain-containing protein [Thioalkalispiraceae bacterium]|jgi:diguanylate cyclase (GGDEF)-like protein/PAS domain S-box-containing protein